MGIGTMISLFRELGADHVELADHLIDQSSIPHVRNSATASGSTINVYLRKSHIGSSSKRSEQRQREDDRRALDRAVEVGAASLLLVPGCADPRADPTEVRHIYADRVAAVSEQAPIPILIENLGVLAGVVGTASHLAGVAERSGASPRVLLDVGNADMADLDFPGEFASLAATLAHVHVKDWVRIGTPSILDLERGFGMSDGSVLEPVPLGTGRVRLLDALGWLEEIGYAGAIGIEYEGGPDPVKALRIGIAYLISRLGQPSANE